MSFGSNAVVTSSTNGTYTYVDDSFWSHLHELRPDGSKLIPQAKPLPRLNSETKSNRALNRMVALAYDTSFGIMYIVQQVANYKNLTYDSTVSIVDKEKGVISQPIIRIPGSVEKIPAPSSALRRNSLTKPSAPQSSYDHHKSTLVYFGAKGNPKHPELRALFAVNVNKEAGMNQFRTGFLSPIISNENGFVFAAKSSWYALGKDEHGIYGIYYLKYWEHEEIIEEKLVLSLNHKYAPSGNTFDPITNFLYLIYNTENSIVTINMLSLQIVSECIFKRKCSQQKWKYPVMLQS